MIEQPKIDTPNSEDKKTESEVKIPDDPLIVEFAETLKTQLGDCYDQEFDKLPLKDRIQQMKLVKKTMEKLAVSQKRSEGKAPIEPDPVPLKNKVKSVFDRHTEGLDLIDSLPKSSVFFCSK